MTTTLWAVRRSDDHEVVAWAPSYEMACDLAYAILEVSDSSCCESDLGGIYVDADEDGTGGREFVEVPEGSQVHTWEDKWFIQDPENEVPEPWNMPPNYVRIETKVQTPYVPIDKTEE